MTMSLLVGGPANGCWSDMPSGTAKVHWASVNHAARLDEPVVTNYVRRLMIIGLPEGVSGPGYLVTLWMLDRIGITEAASLLRSMTAWHQHRPELIGRQSARWADEGPMGMRTYASQSLPEAFVAFATYPEDRVEGAVRLADVKFDLEDPK